MYSSLNTFVHKRMDWVLLTRVASTDPIKAPENCDYNGTPFSRMGDGRLDGGTESSNLSDIYTDNISV